MTANSSVIKNLPLWQIATPGSHDAGSYSKCWLGLVGASALVEQGRSKAQGASIAYQLAYGIRYFDLRFRATPNQPYYVNHGTDVNDVTVDTVLKDIKAFLEKPSTAGEILILELGWDNCSLDEEKLLVSKVCESCGRDRIVTKQTIQEINAKTGSKKQFPAHCTPKELWDAGKKQVIILWGGQAGIIQWKREHDDDSQSDARYIWTGDPDLALESKYIQITPVEENHPTAYALEDLIDGRGRDLEWWWRNYKRIQDESNTRYWWRLGVHLTWQPVLPSPDSLQAGAAQSLPTVLKRLRREWKNKPWNIVSADLFWKEQYIDFVEAVIQLNGQYHY
jgi:hypothetical protein